MAVSNGELVGDHEGHGVQFYEDDAELSGVVVSYLAEGLAAEGSVLVVATEAHRSLLRAGLAATGDLDGAESSGRLIMVDAAAMLAGFTAADDQLDHSRFQDIAEGLISRAASAGRPVRVYGEMVALLWDAGQVTLALELETLWNNLRARLSFSLLCGYPARVAALDSELGAVEQVCRLHTEVAVPGHRPPGLANVSADGNEAVRNFTPARDSARAARQFVTVQLDSRPGDTAAMDAEIVIAELASNAVLHARTPFSVAVSCWPDRVRIAVRDAVPVEDTGRDKLVPRLGHGLDLVTKVASRWAIEPLADGKVVWAELPVRRHEDSR